MPVDVDGELLAEGQLHDGLVLSAPKEREGAAQHDSDEREQRVEHSRIVRVAGFEWEPESRAVAGLSSTDEETRQLRKRQQNQRGRILGTDNPRRRHSVLNGWAS